MDVNIFRKVSKIFLFVTAWIGILGLLAYIPGLGLLGSVNEEYIPMAPSTSISFLIFVFISYFSDRKRGRYSQLFMIFMCGLVTLFGVLEVFGFFFDMDLNFEDQLFPDYGVLGSIPIGRMSFSTGAFFFIEGFAVLGLLYKSKSKKIYKTTGSIATVVILLSLVFLLAYIFGVPFLYNNEDTIPMAITTALAFFFQGFSILFKTDLDAFPLLYLSRKKTSGLIFGTFLPLIVITTFISPIIISIIVANFTLNSSMIMSIAVIISFMINIIVIYSSSRILGKLIDTTRDETKIAENNLKTARIESENLAKFPAENPNPVLRVSEGKVIFKNKASIPILNHWNYTEGGILGKEWAKIIKNVLKTGNSQEIEVGIGDKYFSLIFSPLIDSGESVNIYGLDITDRYQTQIEAENLAKFPTENPNPVLRVSEGKVIFKNRASIPILNHWNYTEGGILGEELLKIIENVLKTGISQEIEEQFGGKFTSLTFAKINSDECNIYGLDITKRKKSEKELHDLNLELEKRVVERTKQLENINNELLSFSYSVSHDLRAPLRSISGFSQAIMDDYEEKLDESGKDFLTRIRNGCEKMGELIEDMLELSRISRTKMRITKVDLSSIASTIVEDLRKINPIRKNVEFIIQENVFADGDKILLRAVMQNLIENSWKFTSKKESARIEFGTTIEKKGEIYFIKDDGAGFDMKYIDKLFGAFQRLHSQLEFSGTGVGLATVKRVVHRHGGKVWAEAELDKGATFYFTLPGIL